MVYIIFATINKLHFQSVAMAPKTYTPVYEKTKKSYAQIRKEKIEAYIKKMSNEDKKKREDTIKKSKAFENYFSRTRLTAEENAEVEKQWVRGNDNKQPSTKEDFKKLRQAKEAKRKEKRKKS